MTKVFTALSVSVDGYITGRDPGAGRGLGDATMLFDWYFSGDTPSQVFDGFRLSEASAAVFDAEASRVGVSLVGRNTYDDSGWGDGGTPHPQAPLVVLSHRPVPVNERQTHVSTGIEEAVTTARELAGSKDVALMGGGVVTAALRAGLLDEVLLHQVPVLLGAGRRFFGDLSEHVELNLLDAVPAPGVTHLKYEVVR